MAKSIRSKWKRKMRVIKRAKNAPKEMKKLKSVIEKGLQMDTIMQVETIEQAETTMQV